MPHQAANDVESEEKKAWAAFCEANPQDAKLFVRLLAIRGGHVVEATVLWELMDHHRAIGLQIPRTLSGQTLQREYGSQFVPTVRSAQRSVEALDSDGLVEVLRTVKNTPQKLRLMWSVLADQLKSVDPRGPGLKR
ncbi:MAG: hypothetical protein KA795_05970 [Burkholderiaceae bacterium]|nr:hypothetical protein [Burkholderiaceae bacterium]